MTIYSPCKFSFLDSNSFFCLYYGFSSAHVTLQRWYKHFFLIFESVYNGLGKTDIFTLPLRTIKGCFRLFILDSICTIEMEIDYGNDCNALRKKWIICQHKQLHNTKWKFEVQLSVIVVLWIELILNRSPLLHRLGEARHSRWAFVHYKNEHHKMLLCYVWHRKHA